MDRHFLNKALFGNTGARTLRAPGGPEPVAAKPVSSSLDLPVSFAELVAASALLDFGAIVNERWPGSRMRDKSMNEKIGGH